MILFIHFNNYITDIIIRNLISFGISYLCSLKYHWIYMCINNVFKYIQLYSKIYMYWLHTVIIRYCSFNIRILPNHSDNAITALCKSYMVKEFEEKMIMHYMVNAWTYIFYYVKSELTELCGALWLIETKLNREVSKVTIFDLFAREEIKQSNTDDDITSKYRRLIKIKQLIVFINNKVLNNILQLYQNIDKHSDITLCLSM